MEESISEIVSRFMPISLEALNAKAAMLERLDHKYIANAAQLRPAFALFAEHFDVLEIDGKRSFTYDTCYFDDNDQHGYYDHHQGRRKRCKVRVRNYLDAGLSYLEVKLKDKRAATIKKRLKLRAPLAELDRTCLDFIEQSYLEHYGESFGLRLQPVIRMEYERVTLVAREGGERMTIDSKLGFQASDHELNVPPDRFILETKSARGSGIADMILRRHHLHPTKSCSKYCIGMAALGRVDKRNRFLPALKRLELAEPK